MKKVLLFLAVVLGLASCTKPTVAPTIPSAQFEGTYVLDLKDVNPIIAKQMELTLQFDGSNVAVDGSTIMKTIVTKASGRDFQFPITTGYTLLNDSLIIIKDSEGQTVFDVVMRHDSASYSNIELVVAGEVTGETIKMRKIAE